MSNELSTETAAQKINMPALPNEFSEENLKKLFKQVESEVESEVFDVTTEDGRKRIKSVAADINKSKTAVDTPMRDYLRVLKSQPKALEKLARNSKVKYEKLRESVLEPLLRAQKYQDDLLSYIEEVPLLCASNSTDSNELKSYIDKIKFINDDVEIWPELAKKFKVAIEAATTSATVTLERVEQQEKQAAELEELRKKQAEAEQKEHDRKVAEDAAEDARKKAEYKAQKEREDVDRRAADERRAKEDAEHKAKQAVIDKEAAEQRAKDEAEAAKRRAAQAKIDAEAQAVSRAEQAAVSERKRIEEEAAEHKRLAEMREADKNHRIKINRAALVALVSGGLSEEDAKMVITMIAKKQVPNLHITY